MARIRSIKPEFWTSEQVADCSPTARLLFVGMWNFCDDQGVHPASPKRLKMEVFPADAFTLEQIEGWIDELREAGLIVEYTAEGQDFWAVTGWHHQKIEKRTNKYPAPPDRKIADHSSTVLQPLDEPSPPERKGEESNGEDGSGVEKRDAASLIKDLAQKTKMPSGGANFDDKANRKARWQQKIIEEINRTERPKRAEMIVAAYARGEAWARQEFEKVDRRIKDRKESFASVDADLRH